MDSGNSPAQRPPRVWHVFPIQCCRKGTHLGTKPISYHPHQDAIVTGIQLHPLEINPHAFPSCLPRGARPGAVSRNRQAGVVVHRQMQIPGRQLEVLPGSEGLSQEPSLCSCAISCPAPFTSRAVTRQNSQDFNSTRKLPVLSFPRHSQLHFQ